MAKTSAKNLELNRLAELYQQTRDTDWPEANKCFEQLLSALGKWAEYWQQRLVGANHIDPGEAESLRYRALIKALRSWQPSRAAFNTYLNTCTLSESKNHVTRLYRSKRMSNNKPVVECTGQLISIDSSVDEDNPRSRNIAEVVADPSTPLPSEQIESVEWLRSAWDILEVISSPFELEVVRCMARGVMSYADIAEHLSRITGQRISAKAADNALIRVKAKCRRCASHVDEGLAAVLQEFHAPPSDGRHHRFGRRKARRKGLRLQSESLQEYYDARVRRGRSDECWLWTGTKHTYSAQGIVHWCGRIVMAHRLAYELEYGVQPARNVAIKQTCGNKLCLNPAHLVAIPFRTAIQAAHGRQRCAIA